MAVLGSSLQSWFKEMHSKLVTFMAQKGVDSCHILDTLVPVG